MFEEALSFQVITAGNVLAVPEEFVAGGAEQIVHFREACSGYVSLHGLPNRCLQFELDVVAACVIGGVSIAGGIGSVGGAVLGAIFLGIIKNALPVVDISPFWQLAISGTAIILAVAFNARAERRKGRVILKKVEVTA